jgi:threonine/homoserine/homoserine lactone efflux protein
MTPEEWIALLALAGAASFTPGPNTTLSTALAANRGLAHAMPFIFAVPVGWGLLLGLCASGLGGIIVAHPLVRWLIQGMGFAYLFWLALQLLKARSMLTSDATPLRVDFFRGVMLQFLNIKAWMLALSVIAGWLAGHPDHEERLTLVLPVMMAFGFFSNLTYALIGSLLRDWLSGPDGSMLRLRRFNQVMAFALVLTAIWMAKLNL